jgi:ribosome maturation factor RimP
MERHALEHLIAEKIRERFDDVELVDFELRGGRDPLLTVYIDRPGGVDLDLCVAVTHALDVLRDTYRLEVSSPGLARPLRKP